MLARMPRYHHEPLDERPEAQAARVPITFEGKEGWAERRSIRTFDYLHPALDEGQSRDKAIRRELRELQLADLGAEWSHDDVAAIRAERVLPGMTRLQVEVAWGWPVSVESTGAPGGERWVYRSRPCAASSTAPGRRRGTTARRRSGTATSGVTTRPGSRSACP